MGLNQQEYLTVQTDGTETEFFIDYSSAKSGRFEGASDYVLRPGGEQKVDA